MDRKKKVTYAVYGERFLDHIILNEPPKNHSDEYDNENVVNSIMDSGVVFLDRLIHDTLHVLNNNSDVLKCLKPIKENIFSKYEISRKGKISESSSRNDREYQTYLQQFCLARTTYSLWEPNGNNYYKRSQDFGTRSTDDANREIKKHNGSIDVAAYYIASKELYDQCESPKLSNTTRILRTYGPVDASINVNEQDILILTAKSLRAANLKISRALSWEKIIIQTCEALFKSYECKEIRKYGTIIIAFETDGCLILRRNSHKLDHLDIPDYSCTFIYDRNGIEGEYMYDPAVYGYNIVLQAAITVSALLDRAKSDNKKPQISIESLVEGIKVGLCAMRYLHELGFRSEPKKGKTTLAFPYEQIAKFMALSITSDFGNECDSVNCGLCYFFYSKRFNNSYTVTHQIPLEKILNPKRKKTFSLLDEYGDYKETAISFAVHGKDQISSIPIGHFEKLVTVDRYEIEKYRVILNQIVDYANSDITRPLSIAVFGKPGTGKSFGIQQILDYILKKEYCNARFKILKFNLSQMNDLKDFTDSLELIRDEGLNNNFPIVFWDEFDSEKDTVKLGWLKYFLSPMQDGSFQGGHTVHPIGRSIFIFAGSTFSSLEEFTNEVRDKHEEYKNFKVEDFISRLKGHIDILGPNPREDILDPCYVVRRAHILNDQLKRRFPQFVDAWGKLHIDENILEAFLTTKKYFHATRSIETLVNMSMDGAGKSYNYSSLPNTDQMRLHIDTRDFFKRISASSARRANSDRKFIISDNFREKMEFIFSRFPMGTIIKQYLFSPRHISFLLTKDLYDIVIESPLYDFGSDYKIVSTKPEYLKLVSVGLSDLSQIAQMHLSRFNRSIIRDIEKKPNEYEEYSGNLLFYKEDADIRKRYLEYELDFINGSLSTMDMYHYDLEKFIVNVIEEYNHQMSGFNQ